MRFFKKIQLIERIDQLIKLKATGSARELASRINLSKSTVYEILELMKMMGAEIEYDSERRSYFYSREKTLSIGFIEMGKVKGGKSRMSSFFGQFDPIFEKSCA